MFKFRKATVSSEVDILGDSPESVAGGPARQTEWGNIGQGDSVSESRFSVLPPKDDQSERYSLSIHAASEEEALSPSNLRGATSCSSNGGSQQQLYGLSDVSGVSASHGKILLDRKRKERHESTSQGQEKKVIRSVSDDESLFDSGKNGDFRRTLSHDSFNPRKDPNQVLGYTIEMRNPIASELAELAKRQPENDSADGSLARRDSGSAVNYYGGAEPQFDVMRKITTSENYEAELQRQLERSANWSTSPPAVKKSHKRRHRSSSRRDATKQPLEIQVNEGNCAEEEMLSPESGSSESVEDMVAEQSGVPNVEIDDTEDMTSQTSERLMALDFSSAQQQQFQHNNNKEQKNSISIRAALGGTSADNEVMLSPRNSVLGKEGIDIPPSPPLHQAPMDPPISRMGYLEGNPVNKMNELARHITALKRQLKSLESEYEQVYGYRPSHSDKLNHKEIRKCVLQLTKTKKELKQIREDPSCLHSMSSVSGVSGNILSVNRGNSIPPVKGTPEYAKYLETTVKEIEKTLGDKRRASHRPDDLEMMNALELQDEKCLMQRQLLVLEKRHGRPSSKAEKDIVRPLYERYRAIKRFSVKVVCVRENNIDLAPIMEHEPLELCEPTNESLPRTVVAANEVWASGESRQLQLNAEDDVVDERNESYNEMTLGELEARLKQAKDEKRRMRAAIRKFESDFQNVAGRPPQKDEKYSSSEMELAYQKYKRTKATVRLLDVLVGKRKVPSLITDEMKN